MALSPNLMIATMNKIKIYAKILKRKKGLKILYV